MFSFKAYPQEQIGSHLGWPGAMQLLAAGYQTLLVHLTSFLTVL